MTFAFRFPDTDELIANETTDKVENKEISKPIDDEEVILNKYIVALKENEELEGVETYYPALELEKSGE